MAMKAFDIRSMSYEKLPSGFGVRVTSLNTRALTPETAYELRHLVYRHKLVIIPEQDLSAPEYVAFGRVLAEPQVYLSSVYHHPDHPEIFVSANGPVEGRKMGVARTGYYWHADCTFETRPLAFTMIYPQVLPTGERSTFFMNMADALQRLSPELREGIRGVYVRHDANARHKITPADVGRALHEILDEIADKAPGAIHPMVIRHPATDEEILFASSGFTSRILKMSLDESWKILREIFRVSEDMAYAHRYEWNEKDIAIWDNRTLLHRSGVIPQGQTSAMFRIGMYDDLPLPGPAATSVPQPSTKELYPC